MSTPYGKADAHCLSSTRAQVLRAKHALLHPVTHSGCYERANYLKDVSSESVGRKSAGPGRKKETFQN